jgi:hypothetical protein
MSAERPPDQRPPTDYRRHRKREDRTQLVLVVLVLVVVGTGLIGLIWGFQNALLGGLCLAVGAVVILGLWGLLSLLEKWVGDD